MRWFLGGLLAILAIITISIAILFYFVPDSAFERHVLSAAARVTDTHIQSSGPPEITLFPSIDMTLRGVKIRQRDRSKPALEAREVHAEVSWLSLLTRWTVDIPELRFIEPELILPAEGEDVHESAPSAPRGTPPYPIPSVSIGRVTFENGSLSGLGEDWRVGNINATVPKAHFDAPMDADFNMILNGEAVAGRVTLKDPRAVDKAESVPIAAKLTGGPVSIEFDGTAGMPDSQPKFGGNLKFDTADIGGTMKWLGQEPPPPALEDNPLSVAGDVRYEADSVTLSGADVKFKEMAAKISGVFQVPGEAFAARDVTVDGLDTARLGVPENLQLAGLKASIAHMKSGEPVTTDFEMSLNGEPVSGTATVPDLDLITAPGAEPIPVKGTVEVPGGSIEFDGKASLPGTGELESAAGWAAEGRLKLKTDSVRKTAGLLGVELPEGDVFHATQFEGDVTATGTSIAVANMSATLDGTAASGNFAVDYSAQRPAVTAKLDVDKIDTARYAGAEAAPVQVAQLESAAAPPYELILVPLKASLEAYLAKGTGGPAAASHLERLPPAVAEIWSKASLGADRLREAAADVDLDLNVGELRHGAVYLGKTALSAKLQEGELDLDILESKPLEGTITGKVKVNARNPLPAYEMTLDVGGIAVDKVLQLSEMGKSDIIRGKLTGKAKLSASGTSEADLVRSLNGSVSSEFRDGVIVGYDVAGAVRRFSTPQYNPRHTTSYDVIKADFAVANGIARSSNLSLDGPQFRFKANGTANLETTAINYKSDLSLVPPPSLIPIPLDFYGTWRRVQMAVAWVRGVTAWTGPLPFDGLESARRSDIGDPELQKLVGELLAKEGVKTIPPRVADLFRELTNKSP